MSKNSKPLPAGPWIVAVGWGFSGAVTSIRVLARDQVLAFVAAAPDRLAMNAALAPFDQTDEAALFSRAAQIARRAGLLTYDKTIRQWRRP